MAIERVYRVGKRVGNRLVPAFRIRRLESGGIRLFDIKDANDLERGIVIAHFGRMFRSSTGVGSEQHRRVFKPGTVEHFEHAVHELPHPFALMRKS